MSLSFENLKVNKNPLISFILKNHELIDHDTSLNTDCFQIALNNILI